MENYDSITRCMYGPERSYLGMDFDVFEGFLWFQSDMERIAGEALAISALTQSKSELTRIVQAVYPIYADAVSSGKYPAYQFGTESARMLADIVSAKTGIEKSTVVPILTAIENLARRGEIKVEVWNTALKKPSAAQTVISQASAAVWEQGIAKPISSAFNKLLVAGAVVGLVYLLGKTYILKKI